MNNIRFSLTLLSVLALLSACNNEPGNKQNVKSLSRRANIFPDYTQVVIPVNSAPLNFRIKETGDAYYVELTSHKKQEKIVVKSNSCLIRIEIKLWHRFLENNNADSVSYNIFVHKNDSGWVKFAPFTNYISSDSIDEYVVYRQIGPVHVLWYEMGIYQRNLSSFKEKPIVLNRLLDHACINCHNFWNHNAEKMVFHIRGSNKGTILSMNNQLKKLETKTKFTMSPAVYPAWHPNGKLIAFSVNRISQSFNNNATDPIEVLDKASDLIVYNIEKNEITTSEKISRSGRETYPTWTPDGKYLYYCYAPKFDPNIVVDSTRYSLMRIAFDAQTNTWGEPEIVIDADVIKKSITFPRFSPDGKYILVTVSDHGCFPIFLKSADLYLYDLQNNTFKSLEINSDNVDSYHSWSYNGKWIVFSSKRLDGFNTRLFISYFNNGSFSKPFVIPQENPEYYDLLLRNYNVPELVKSEIKFSPVSIASVAKKECQRVHFDPNVNIDALSGATKIVKE